MRPRVAIALALATFAVVACSDPAAPRADAPRSNDARTPTSPSPSRAASSSPSAAEDAAARTPVIRGDLVIEAAGDIACAAPPGSSRSSCRYDLTGDLVDARGIDAVLTLGDNQYETGALEDYRRYFDATWGRVLERIRPVPGNHEHAQDPSSTPSGYFRYFGRSVRGPDGLGYYSYDLGACPDAPCWHLIALDSELCFDDGGCTASTDPSGSGERMYAWLRDDLAAHPSREYPCTLAYWHHPLFSTSTGSGATSVTRPLWRLLAHANAEIVLNGHSHNYQRWAPMTPAGKPDARGIREFVVGTGGASHYALTSARPRTLDAAQDDAFGVLRLVLDARRYRWQWLSGRGQTPFEDTGAGRCH